MTAPPDRRAIITDALRKIDDLTARLEIAEKADTEPIAVVGIACPAPRWCEHARRLLAAAALKLPAVNRNGSLLLAIPDTVTNTFTMPAEILLGTSTRMLVSLQFKTGAMVDPKVTLPLPATCVAPNDNPLIVIGVPCVPDEILRPVTTGALDVVEPDPEPEDPELELPQPEIPIARKIKPTANKDLQHMSRNFSEPSRLPFSTVLAV